MSYIKSEYNETYDSFKEYLGDYSLIRAVIEEAAVDLYNEWEALGYHAIQNIWLSRSPDFDDASSTGSFSFNVFSDGEYTIYAISNDGTETNSITIKYNMPNYIPGHDGERFSLPYPNTKEYVDTNLKTATIPEGFSVGISDGINTIDEGLVIRDANGNEFVWIPTTTDFTEYYGYGSYRDGELGEYIYQDDLDKYYGKNYYSKDEDGPNHEQYKEMTECVNKYDGFYIGRYETTVDENGLGSKLGANVLTSTAVLKDGINSENQNNPFYYGIIGMYAEQRKAKVTGNGNTVQTNVISMQELSAVITYFNSVNTDYSATKLTTLTTSGIQTAGQSRYSYNKNNVSDVICNIFDLRGNVQELTFSCIIHYGGGQPLYQQLIPGCFEERYEVSDREFHYIYRSEFYNSFEVFGGRLTLCIK